MHNHLGAEGDRAVNLCWRYISMRDGAIDCVGVQWAMRTKI